MTWCLRVLICLLLSATLARADPKDELFTAAADGNLEVVNGLLTAYPDLANSRDLRSRTPLHLAAAHGHGPVVARLILAGADPNAHDQTANTPLHNAAKNNREEIMARLIFAGAKLNSLNCQKQIPLAIADQRLHPRESGVTNRPLTPRSEARSQITHVSTPQAPPTSASPVISRLRLSGSNPLLRSLSRIGGHGAGAAAAAAAAEPALNAHPEVPPILRRQTISGITSGSPVLPPLRLSGTLGSSLSCDLSVDASQAAASPAAVPLSLLEQFIATGNVEALQRLLLARRFDPTMLCSGGSNLLHLAAANGQLQSIWFLFRIAEDLLNLVDDEGFSPLHRAAQKGHLVACAVLISLGANVLEETRRGLTFVEVAKEAEFAQVGALISQLVPSTMLALVQEGREDQVLESLLRTTRFAERMLECDLDGRTLLHHLILAAGKGHQSRSMLSSAQVASLHRTPRVTIEILLDAQKGALIEMVNLADNKGRTPLHLAAERNRSDLIALLVAAGANTEAVDKEGMTPLNCAAKDKNEEAAIALLDHGARPNVRGVLRRTPLHWAVYNNNQALVRRLVLASAESLWDVQTTTPLHLAAEGQAQSLTELLNGDFDLNQSNVVGDRPLHVAMRGWLFNNARMLMIHGAAATVENAEHQTPYLVTPEDHRHEIDEMLAELRAVRAELRREAEVQVDLRQAVARSKLLLETVRTDLGGGAATQGPLLPQPAVLAAAMVQDPEDEARAIADNMPMERTGDAPWILAFLHPRVAEVLSDAVRAAIIAYLGSMTSHRRS